MKKISLKNKKVFIAGHTGLVGQSLCKRLENEKCKILFVNKKKLDLRDFNKTDRWLKLNKPDYIFIAAARVGGILENSSYPANFIYDNLSIALNLIHLSYKNNIKKVLYLGSSCIYPKFSKQPIKEDSLLTGPLEPTNEWYAIAKIAGLKLCKAYGIQYKKNFISAMPTNLYGPGDNFHPENGHVIPALMTKFSNATDDVVTCWGDGTPMREFTYVDDLADACMFAVEHYDNAELINVGSGQDISIFHLAHKIATLTGFTGKIEWDTNRPNGTPKRPLDYSKITAKGWKPKYDLDTGLAKAYEWFQESKK